jgi:DNA-binding transcriptional LysR family regulator
VGPLNVRVQVGSTEAVKEAVKAGLGVSIVSRRAVQTETAAGALSALKVEGVDLSRELVLVTSTDRTRSGICAAFLEHVRANARSI